MDLDWLGVSEQTLDTTQRSSPRKIWERAVLDKGRLGKHDRLGKNSCEQMLLQLFCTLFCIEQLTGHEVHRFFALLCQDVSEILV